MVSISTHEYLEIDYVLQNHFSELVSSISNNVTFRFTVYNPKYFIRRVNRVNSNDNYKYFINDNPKYFLK